VKGRSKSERIGIKMGLGPIWKRGKIKRELSGHGRVWGNGRILLLRKSILLFSRGRAGLTKVYLFFILIGLEG
jgi:hypothetical protein